MSPQTIQAKRHIQLLECKQIMRVSWNIAALLLLFVVSLSGAKAQEEPTVGNLAENRTADVNQQVDTAIDVAIAKQVDGLADGSANRWMVVLCGLPGDDEHRTRLTDAVRKLITSAPAVFQFDKSRMRVLAGDETMRSEIADTFSETGICTRESVATVLESLGSDIAPSDTCMLFLLGHAQLYEARSTFNVQGIDFDGTELASWMKPIQCLNRVFWITTPVSGFWLKPLSGPCTTVISATEPDLEFTATEMPYALADIVAGSNGAQPLNDIDEDGKLTMLDLYLAVNLEIHQRFRTAERLQTEHAQLDDNGDGIGKELQADFLPSDESPENTTASTPKPRVRATQTVNSDGDFSSTILISVPPSTNETGN